MIEIPANHWRKGDCIIRRLVDDVGRALVLVDYPHLDLKGRREYLDDLRDPQSGDRIPVEKCEEPLPAIIIIRAGQPIDSLPVEKIQTVSPAPATLAPAAVAPWQTARRALLALRLGQSTAESVHDLSVGLTEVDEACRWALDRAATGQVSFLLFESPYGMGKSHALARLRLLARQSKMATGTVVLDGVGISLCQPMSLVTALSHAIEYPGPTSEGLPQRLAGLVLHDDAVDELRNVGADFLHRSLANLKPEHVEDADLWEMVEDYLCLEASAGQVTRQIGVRLPPLRALRLVERPKRCANLLREWAQACTVTGARNGLVLLLDEADVDYGQRGRTLGEREQRSSLIQAWKELAEAGPHGDSYGRLVVALAITPGTPGTSEPDPVEELKQEFGPHLQTVRLRELTAAELRDLGGRICALYCNAYELPEERTPQMDATIAACLSRLERAAEGRNPRKFIRLLVEKLDAAYAYA